MSPARRLAIAFLHASAAGYMTYGYKGLGTLSIDPWIRSQKGGHFQFLTINGLVVAWLTMLISVALDLFPTPILSKIKRILLMISMPVEVVVMLFYWTLLFIHPSLILIPEPQLTSPSSSIILARIPLPIDLAIHLAPALTLFADFVLLERKYTENAASYGAPLVVSLSTVWYSCWVEYCARFNGSFPYPFLEQPLKIRVGVYVLAAVVALFSFWAINNLHPDTKKSKTS